MTPTTETPMTFLEAIIQSLLNAAAFNSGDSVAPAAVLWADVEGEWLPIVAKLQELMPQLIILGDYDPQRKTGPAIWIRCVIEGVLPEVKLPEEAAPIIYLPRVSRQLLRSPEECPEELQPLVELQYRGSAWTQANGKDWTVEAFLVSENGGLGLDVSRDQKTRRALQGALEPLATTPISLLRGHKLEAEDFDKLMVGDTVRDLLVWIGDPTGCKDEWEANRWTAFRSRCREEYVFDPESDGEIVAAEKLGSKHGPWVKVWQRFAESPTLYPGVPGVLRRAKPSTLLFDREPWPDENEKDEASLRAALRSFDSLKPSEARDTIKKLDETHGIRRQWVWARMGLSPLARALEHLTMLAVKTATVLIGNTPDAMADAYAKAAFETDDCALRSLDAVKSVEDREAVREAVRAIYLPWLEDSARRFQMAVEKQPLPDSSAIEDRLVSAGPKECILFVDGLRYDIAQRLITQAHTRNLAITEGFRWTALPSVTGTAKPAVSPVAKSIQGGQAGEDFMPVMADSKKPATTSRLHDLLASAGYQILHGLDSGRAAEENARGWSEFGEFDALGHKLQAKMVSHIDDQLDLLIDRIVHLLDAGWNTVRVVTDHGWLLLPGGLPSTPLPKYLSECRWSRCAVIKEGAAADVPKAGWFWDRSQSVAFAPGAYCFVAGSEYAHGGLSVQECLVPDFVFSSPSGGKQLQIAIENIQWLGLRCRVTVKPSAPNLSAVLRTKPNDKSTDMCAPKNIDQEGRVGLLVEDENLAGTSACLVVCDSSNTVLCKQVTIIGGES